VDDGFSASRFAKKQRKGWLALQADIRAGRVQAVIMRTPSRGSRAMSDWVQFLDLCR
jgi:DNA invertase Pin-like site-specific DNA recombinase